MGFVESSSLLFAVRCLARRRLAWFFPTFERRIASARLCCAQFVLNCPVRLRGHGQTIGRVPIIRVIVFGGLAYIEVPPHFLGTAA